MLILIQLPGKLTYNKIGLTKVLKYNFADIVTGILPKNHFYGSYLGFCVLSNFFGTLRQTPIRQTRQSDKHKRKSGRQENPTNSGQRQSGKHDNLWGLVVPYFRLHKNCFCVTSHFLGGLKCVTKNSVIRDIKLDQKGRNSHHNLKTKQKPCTKVLEIQKLATFDCFPP